MTKQEIIDNEMYGKMCNMNYARKPFDETEIYSTQYKSLPDNIQEVINQLPISDDYKQMDSEDAFIIELIKQNFKDTEIIERLQENFKISMEDARAKFITTVRGLNLEENLFHYKKLKIKDNVGFTTRLMRETNSIIILIENIDNINYLEFIPMYLDSFLKLSNDKQEPIILDLFKEICNNSIKKDDNKLFEDIDTDKIKQEELELEQEAEIQFDEPRIKDKLFDILFSDDEDEDEDEDQDEEEDEDRDEDEDEDQDEDLDEKDDEAEYAIKEDDEDEKKPYEEEQADLIDLKGLDIVDTPDKKELDKKVDKEVDEDEEVEEEELKELSEKSNPILKRLINKEPRLFSTDKNKFYDEYSRLCPANAKRQPVILTQEEKDVFKTAFELDQRWLVDLSADRTPHISQAQSINLFLPADVHKRDLHQIHFQAWKKGLKSLYYCRSKSIQRAENVNDAKSTDVTANVYKSNQQETDENKYEECLSCQ